MANTNFTAWLGNNATSGQTNAYSTARNNNKGFEAGGYIKAEDFNAVLRMTTLICAGVVDAFNFTGNIDSTVSSVVSVIKNPTFNTLAVNGGITAHGLKLEIRNGDANLNITKGNINCKNGVAYVGALSAETIVSVGTASGGKYPIKLESVTPASGTTVGNITATGTITAGGITSTGGITANDFQLTDESTIIDNTGFISSKNIMLTGSASKITAPTISATSITTTNSAIIVDKPIKELTITNGISAQDITVANTVKTMRLQPTIGDAMELNILKYIYSGIKLSVDQPTTSFHKILAEHPAIPIITHGTLFVYHQVSGKWPLEYSCTRIEGSKIVVYRLQIGENGVLEWSNYSFSNVAGGDVPVTIRVSGGSYSTSPTGTLSTRGTTSDGNLVLLQQQSTPSLTANRDTMFVPGTGETSRSITRVVGVDKASTRLESKSPYTSATLKIGGLKKDADEVIIDVTTISGSIN